MEIVIGDFEQSLGFNPQHLAAIFEDFLPHWKGQLFSECSIVLSYNSRPINPLSYLRVANMHPGDLCILYMFSMGVCVEDVYMDVCIYYLNLFMAYNTRLKTFAFQVLQINSSPLESLSSTDRHTWDSFLELMVVYIADRQRMEQDVSEVVVQLHKRVDDFARSEFFGRSVDTASVV